MKYKFLLTPHSSLITTRLSSIAIIGLGRVGRFVSQYLMHNQNYVYGYDDKKNVFIQRENKPLVNNKLFKPIADYQLITKNKKLSFAVCSPGIADMHRAVQTLKRNKIPIFDEIEFTYNQLINSKTRSVDEAMRTSTQKLRNSLIAITGTNGKSTTTSLMGHILDTAGKNVFWGGNLAPGLPFVVALFQEPKEYYVLETSSFQLQRTYKFHPHITVLLNITADHLDRHKCLSEYREAKFKIFANQTKNDYAVINYEDITSMGFRNLIPSRKIYFSRYRRTNGAYLYRNYIYFKKERICRIDEVKLLGSHFIDCILSAVTVVKLIGIKNHIIKNTLRNFVGLEHRLEFVAEIDNVKYINNSMCTNPSAGVKTLQAFNKPVILIAGGKEKNLEVDDYIKEISKKSRLTILLGDNRKRLGHLLDKIQYSNYILADSLNQAVHIAREKSKLNEIVLFSPGFASFDNFANFQERGNAFKEIVYALA